MPFLRKHIYLGMTKSQHLARAQELAERAATYQGSSARELASRDRDLAVWHVQAADKIEFNS